VGLLKPIRDLAFQLEFNSLAHLVQKLTTYEQRHLELYQDKFKRQVTLVDTEDAEDSGDDQEVVVAEWTRGANPVSCKWVKQKGPAKGFDFDRRSCRGDHVASGMTLSPTTRATARNSVGRSNRLLSKAD
jgi:hypothetical protein